MFLNPKNVIFGFFFNLKLLVFVSISLYICSFHDGAMLVLVLELSGVRFFDSSRHYRFNQNGLSAGTSGI